MAKTDVAIVQQGDDLPDYLRGQTFGKEDNFGAEDVFVPQIKLLQGLSEAVTAGHEGAKIGQFWHGGADLALGDQFTFVIGDRRKKYLLSTPIADGQGVLARADDAVSWDRSGEWQVKLKDVKKPVTWRIGQKPLKDREGKSVLNDKGELVMRPMTVEESGLAAWGSSNPDDPDSPPAATLFYDYLIVCLERPDLGPAVISLARSQIRKAKKELNPKIKVHLDAGRPMQALKFSATSVDDMADGQSFKNWSFRAAGFADKATFEQMREYRGALANLKVQDEAGDLEVERGVSDTGEGDY